MSRSKINYSKESEKYKPNVVKTLLIGEAPPPSEDKYFYVPKRMSNKIPIKKDQTLPSTIFYHYFQKRPETEIEYVEFLERLRKMGIFLIDIIDEPIRIRDRKLEGQINKENLRLLVNKIPKLRSKIKSRGIEIDDKNIIFLLARTHYKKKLKKKFPKSKFFRWIDFRMYREI